MRSGPGKQFIYDGPTVLSSSYLGCYLRLSLLTRYSPSIRLWLPSGLVTTVRSGRRRDCKECREPGVTGMEGLTSVETVQSWFLGINVFQPHITAVTKDRL